MLSLAKDRPLIPAPFLVLSGTGLLCSYFPSAAFADATSSRFQSLPAAHPAPEGPV
jgi:hypothetical protein